jgi:hypothetical protein
LGCVQAASPWVPTGPQIAFRDLRHGGVLEVVQG